MQNQVRRRLIVIGLEKLNKMLHLSLFLGNSPPRISQLALLGISPQTLAQMRSLVWLFSGVKSKNLRISIPDMKKDRGGTSLLSSDVHGVDSWFPSKLSSTLSAFSSTCVFPCYLTEEEERGLAFFPITHLFRHREQSLRSWHSMQPRGDTLSDTWISDRETVPKLRGYFLSSKHYKSRRLVSRNADFMLKYKLGSLPTDSKPDELAATHGIRIRRQMEQDYDIR
ncbi:hypothetical protein L1987_16768 [Smallanthus sonchifolius]|uniref:Uncharacterized protein n=1 Tax=Smallanthus sonchifolius TaxID=185202 RepID=A0ACB9IV06_9ASTR|nr:hypothetical protein L1987_16768 [Smallanthus sonchifolius]